MTDIIVSTEHGHTTALVTLDEPTKNPSDVAAAVNGAREAARTAIKADLIARGVIDAAHYAPVKLVNTYRNSDFQVFRLRFGRV